VFGDAEKVRFTPLSAQQRFTALQTGEIDVLSRNTTWTQSRDAGLGVNFVGVIYHDGQGFMVKRSLNVKSAKELDGATVCMNAGTTTELNAADFFRSNKLKFTPVTFDKSDETVFAYDAGRCDAFSTDQSALYAQRIKLKQPDTHAILSELISKEPLGPVVRQGDEEWFDIARWTLFALINAEDLGITSKNADEMKGSANPEVRRFLGTEGEMGKNLGLAREWGYNIVTKVGSYGEVFERNVGQQSPLKISRGLNAPWNQGGILFAPPIR
jgi:general L-amino acid transport system substrate-binding protein